MGMIIGLFLAFVAGLILISMGFVEPDFDLASRIFAIICGIIMVLPGLIIGPQAVASFRETKKKANGWIGLIKNCLKFVFLIDREEINEDTSSVEERISDFRKAYKDFFIKRGIEENSVIQENVTQTYWNILVLQKKRLEKKNLTMDMTSKRVRYGEHKVVTDKKCFDGKYEVTEATETLSASKVYKNNDTVIGRDKCTKVGRYKFIDAKRTGKGNIICPNCGNSSSRENLLDGCDYCGTKFTVEDLGERVSDFGFRSDYDIEYDIYRDFRSRFALWVGLIVGVPTFLLNTYECILLIVDGDYDVGLFIAILCSILVDFFVTAVCIFFAICFFYFFIFPVIQLVASLINIRWRKLAALKTIASDNQAIENRIKKDDNLFSINGFYSSIQNKLGTIFYGETKEEICAFAEGKKAENDILAKASQYADVINAETEWIKINKYENNKKFSRLHLECLMTFTKEKNHRLSRESRQIGFTVVRDRECKTQAICEPVYFKCASCGAPMSLLEGKICKYCGNERINSDFDWVIERFDV